MQHAYVSILGRLVPSDKEYNNNADKFKWAFKGDSFEIYSGSQRIFEKFKF